MPVQGGPVDHPFRLGAAGLDCGALGQGERGHGGLGEIAAGGVFTTELRAPTRRTAFSARVWRPAVNAAGLPQTVTFHALRTSTRACSSGTASRSRPSRRGWGTRAPPRRWTPTAASGPTRT